MLEKYKIGQPIAYDILNNAIKNNKLSHAYLFDSDDSQDSMNFIFDFVKEIICKDVGNARENIIERINNDNYLDVKVIEADGLWIKKEQLLDLQDEFSKKAIEGSKKIYVIKSAEKMNNQTANSILKFLEEPVDDIVAILITNNISLLLPTIVSRCQIIKLLKNNKGNLIHNLICSHHKDYNDEQCEDIIKNVKNIVYSLEYEKLNSIIYSKKIWHNVFNNRDDIILSIELLIYFYYDVLRFSNNLTVNCFNSESDFINELSQKNKYLTILEKINVLNDALYGAKRNLNINLLVDKLIIDMCGDSV